MNIVVCIKQVPDPARFADIVVDPVKGTIKREGIPAVINPVDRNALEAALHMKERFGGGVTVLTMGPPQASQSLEEALAMGGDEAVLLSDRAFSGADALATARTLAKAISLFLPFDLIFCGNESVDSGTSQVGPELAELLDVPHVANASAIDFYDAETAQIKRSFGSYAATISMKLPGVITVNRQLNEPRFITVAGILGVAAKSLKTYGITDLQLTEDQVGLKGSPTRMSCLTQADWCRDCSMLKGDPEQVTSDMIARIRQALATM